MGREIRMVPSDWEHPTVEKYNPITGQMEIRYQPMYDRPVQKDFDEWLVEYESWCNGGRDDTVKDYPDSVDLNASLYESFCDYWGHPPDPAYYRPDWPEGLATHFQVYQTISEGSPVTPAFATREELIDYLVENGDFWDQERRRNGDTIMNCEPWSRDAAESFVNAGWAPSLIGKAGEGVEIGAKSTLLKNP